MDLIKITAWHGYGAVLMIAAVLGVVVIYKRGETKILKDILFRLVTRAETEFVGCTGELKRAAVIDWLYARMPAPLRVLITRREIDRLINDVLAYAKGKWETNPKLRELVGKGTDER